MDAVLNTSLRSQNAVDQRRYHIFDGAGSEDSPKSDSREMIKSELLGEHTHATGNGIKVNIFERQERIIARGRFLGRSFGVTLGQSAAEAKPRLFELMTELENGSFVPPSQRRRRKLRRVLQARLTPRELFVDFIADTRQRRGRKTADTYWTRLSPLLDFFEQAGNRQHWRLAEDIDRDCVLKLRAFLASRMVTVNGRSGAPLKPMSVRQIKNCLETLRAAINWALSADVRKLPIDYCNPVSRDLVGQTPQKDPLRKEVVPIDLRVQLVSHMNAWELTHLAGRLLLPLRHEELCGILISDVDWKAKTLYIGTRFGGADFTKGRTSFTLPIHPLPLQLWAICADGRPEGLLFRKASAWKKPSAKVRTTFASRDAIEARISEVLATCKADDVENENDRKQVIREFFYKNGGMHPDDIRRSMKRLYGRVGLSKNVRAYDLRGSISQSMLLSGMAHLESRYLTGHAVTDIMNEYVGLDPETHMARYYDSIAALLDAFRLRAEALGYSLKDQIVDKDTNITRDPLCGIAG